MIKGLPLAYNKDFQEDKEALFDVVSTGSQCFRSDDHPDGRGLSFREDRLEAAVASDFSNATDVADYLVAWTGALPGGVPDRWLGGEAMSERGAVAA